jgi:hypothetical protein
VSQVTQIDLARLSELAVTAAATARLPPGGGASTATGGIAYELLFQVGQSRCDVVRMGRQHVQNGTLSLQRQKVAFSAAREIKKAAN